MEIIKMKDEQLIFKKNIQPFAAIIYILWFPFALLFFLFTLGGTFSSYGVHCKKAELASVFLVAKT